MSELNRCPFESATQRCRRLEVSVDSESMGGANQCIRTPSQARFNGPSSRDIELLTASTHTTLKSSTWTRCGSFDPSLAGSTSCPEEKGENPEPASGLLMSGTRERIGF
jgi:hypothetical protein